jgi:hypothetical protein
MVPELKHGCNSWVATRKATGEVIGEFFVRTDVEKFNHETVLVETTADYLARYNAEVRRAYA